MREKEREREIPATVGTVGAGAGPGPKLGVQSRFFTWVAWAQSFEPSLLPPRVSKRLELGTRAQN